MKSKFRSFIGFVSLLCVFLLSGCRAEPPAEVVLPDFDFTQVKVCADEELDLEAYDSFMDNAADTGLVIPALEQYFVPQGLTYWEEMNWFVISGYFKPTDYSKASAIVCVEAKTGRYVGEYTVRGLNGELLDGHFGGVAITRDNLYLADGELLRIPLSDLKAAEGKGELQVAEVIGVPFDLSFCSYADGVLWVGEFYERKAYPCDHEYKNNDGKMHYAWALGYKEDKALESGIESDPSYVLSIPEKVQCLTVAKDGRIFLSRSYGRRNDSLLTICQNPLKKDPDQMVTVNEKQVPMWFLDNANGLQNVISLPMAEGCCAIGREIYLVHESAAYCYREDYTSASKNPADTIWKYTLR